MTHYETAMTESFRAQIGERVYVLEIVAMSYNESIKFSRDISLTAKRTERELKWAGDSLASIRANNPHDLTAVMAAEQRVAEAEDAEFEMGMAVADRVLSLIRSIDGDTDFRNTLPARVVTAAASAAQDFLLAADLSPTIIGRQNGSGSSSESGMLTTVRS